MTPGTFPRVEVLTRSHLYSYEARVQTASVSLALFDRGDSLNGSGFLSGVDTVAVTDVGESPRLVFTTAAGVRLEISLFSSPDVLTMIRDAIDTALTAPDGLTSPA